jgi:hypothetical protein
LQHELNLWGLTRFLSCSDGLLKVVKEERERLHSVFVRMDAAVARAKAEYDDIWGLEQILTPPEGVPVGPNYSKGSIHYCINFFVNKHWQ